MNEESVASCNNNNMLKPIGETGENVCVSAFGIIGVDVWLHDEMDSSFNHAAYYRHHIHTDQKMMQHSLL